MVRFSVVIPLYNKEKSIPKTVDSVLKQSFKDFELVIVNDGSTDKSRDVVQGLDDFRIRIIDKPNGGVSSARNKGILEAKNEWIALLDGDDIWLPNHLENLAKAIEIHPNAMVFYTGYANSKTNDFSLVSSDFSFVVKDYWAMALRGKAICSSCVCFNSSVFNDMPMFRTDLTHGEDLDVWRRLVQRYSVVMIPSVTAIYRIGAENSAVRHVANPRKTIIWDLDIANIHDLNERLYFTRIYYGFLFSYFPLHLLRFFTLLKRKHFWGMRGFCGFWVNVNIQRLKRRFL